jgi:alkylation response protein AidB-like acyl-CoA dehydrogenase
MLAFELTESQRTVRALAAEFAEREILPRAVEIDKTDDGVGAVWQAMSREPYRYTGMHIPDRYGGKEIGLLEAVILTEEIAAVGKSPVCSVLFEIAGLGTLAIVEHGSEYLRKEYLPAVVKGEQMCCYGLTEPGMGSDGAGIQCRAQKVDQGYLINGRKRYISFAHESAYIVLFAATDPTKGARGISAFVFPTSTPGFKVAARVPCMGLRGHQDEELLFKDCLIPHENLIGEEGRGLSYALKTLDSTRTTLTAAFLGLARASLEESTKYAETRKTFGKELYHRQSLSYPLAEIAARIDAARLLNYQAAWLHDQGKKNTVEAAKAKTLATGTMLDAVNMAMEIHGGWGCAQGHIVERMYRDARIWSFAQGTPQMMKFIISRDLFGNYEM